MENYSIWIGMITVESRKECLMDTLNDIRSKSNIIEINKIYCNNLDYGLKNLTLNWMNFLSDFLNSDSKKALMLEDDIIVSSKFDSVFNKTCKANIDCITYALMPKHGINVGNNDILVPVRKDPKQNWYGSMCILINRNIAEILIKQLGKIHLDKLISTLYKDNKISLMYTNPSVINHKEEICTWKFKHVIHKAQNYEG